MELSNEELQLALGGYDFDADINGGSTSYHDYDIAGLSDYKVIEDIKGGGVKLSPTSNHPKGVIDSAPLECVCKKSCNGNICDSKKKKTCIDDSKINETLKLYYESIFNKKNSDIFDVISELINHHSVETESCLLLHPEYINFAQNKGLSKSHIESYIEQYFLPRGPRDMINGKWPWLSNHDIDTVLNRLVVCYPDFQNIGFQMIDFKTHGTLYNYQFAEQLKKDKKRFGVVINTDVSSGNGIHWFCMFYDFSSSDVLNIEFFNSSGRGPTKEIQELINKLSGEYKVKTYINRTAHQKKDSECGVYALFYIWARLKNISIDKLFNHIIKDEQMEQFRKYLFRKC